MKKHGKIKRLLSALLIVSLFLPLLFTVRATATSENTEGDVESTTTETASEVKWQDYNGKKIGIIGGTPLEDAAKEYLPDSELLYYDKYPDLGAALLAGKIDAFLVDEPVIKTMRVEQPGLDFIRDRITETEQSFAFRKDDEDSARLCAELDEFLEKSYADGTMQEIDDIWFGADEDKKVVDLDSLSGENGTITVVTTASDEPYSYVKNGKNVGYDMDLVYRFCEERGYAVELMDVDFAGRIPAVQSGKADFSTDMNVTEERKEEVLFSEATSTGGIVLAVPAADLEGVQEDEEIDLGSISSEYGGGGIYESLADLEGKKIGVLQGSYFDVLTQEKIKDAKPQYYNTMADMVNALKTGKIDGFSTETPAIRMIMLQNDDITFVTDYLNATDFAYVLPKSEEGRSLNDKLSKFVKEKREDGTLDELDSIWLGADEDLKVVEDYTSYPDTNGTLTLATTAQQGPFSYVKDGQVVGFEIDLAARFCKEYGYRLKIEIMDFAGILPAVQAGKVDLGASSISITEERKESVDFSEPYYNSVGAVAVLKKNTGNTSFLESIKDSFVKTFIREDRYKLFISGILTTLLIVVLAIIFGTILGFLVFMACRRGNKAANLISRFFTWLILGMPIVVLLMVLYYIIFANSSISGTAVAVIAFTLVFGAATFGMLKSGVGAIDIGQTEAAYALGYGDLKSFFRIILPQAIPHFLPAYKGEIVTLVKSSAVVGYIAVQDLTKMGDIIRGRTYEAFFPLIAVAVIYFILSGILNFIVGRIEIRINPKRRKRDDILKGVQTNDRA